MVIMEETRNDARICVIKSNKPQLLWRAVASSYFFLSHSHGAILYIYAPFETRKKGIVGVIYASQFFFCFFAAHFIPEKHKAICTTERKI